MQMLQLNHNPWKTSNETEYDESNLEAIFWIFKIYCGRKWNLDDFEDF